MFVKLYLLSSILAVFILISVISINWNISRQPPYSHASSLYPPDTTLTAVPYPSVPRPNYLSPVIDPIFKTQIFRISDQNAFGLPNEQYLRNVYAKIQPWNSDDSLIMLSYAYTVPLLNGNNYQFIKNLHLGNNQAIWSNTNPHLAYDRVNNQLVKIDMPSGSESVLHTFPEYTSISIGEGEGNISNDDHYVALLAKQGTNTYMLVYDLLSGNVIATKSLAGLWPDWVSMSQSGNYVVVEWTQSSGKGVDVYDNKLNFLRHLSNLPEHGDLGFDTSGHEVLVQFDSPTWDIIALRLDGSGNLKVKAGNWTGTHISCRNILRPGWCYVSDSLGDLTTNRSRAGSNEVYAIKIDGSETVERFAHQYQSANLPYGAHAFAVPNQDGTQVMWGSDWQLGPTAPAYAYVARMPQNASSIPSPTSTTNPCSSLSYTITADSGYTFTKDCIRLNAPIYSDDQRFTFFRVPPALNSLPYIKSSNLGIKNDQQLQWSITSAAPSTIYIAYRKIPNQQPPAWITNSYTKLTPDRFADLAPFLLRKNDQGLIGVYDIYRANRPATTATFGPASDAVTTAYSMYLVILAP